MAIDGLLARLERRAVTPVTADVTPDVTPKPAPAKACTPVTSVTAEDDDTAGKAISERLSDSTMEARRQHVLGMLVGHPEARYAVLTDTAAEPGAVIVVLAIRGQASYELRIPRAKYDPFLFLDLIDRHAGTIQ